MCIRDSHTVMLVFWTAHGGVMNRKAVERANLPEEYRYVEKEGYFNRDDVSFHVRGEIYALHTEEEFVDIYTNLANKCAGYGITTICALDGMMVKDDIDVYKRQGRCSDRGGRNLRRSIDSGHAGFQRMHVRMDRR